MSHVKFKKWSYFCDFLFAIFMSILCCMLNLRNGHCHVTKLYVAFSL